MVGEKIDIIIIKMEARSGSGLCETNEVVQFLLFSQFGDDVGQ